MGVSTKFSTLGFAITILGGLCLVGWVLADDKDKSKVKPNVIEVDLSKLPPDVAKQILETLKKEEAKPISLTEAINIAEKAGKGQAIKAERKGEGADTQFQVEVVGKDGARSRISLNAAGKVQETEGSP